MSHYKPYPAYKDSGVEWLGRVPEHWQVKRLKFIANVQTGVAKGKDNQGKDTVEVPYLRVANVQDGYLSLDDVTTIEIPREDLPRYSLRPGDVLMNEGGDFDKLGRGHVWQGEIEPCIHQNHVFAVRPTKVPSYWLNAFTGSLAAQFYFMGRSKQSTNLASISSSNVMELPVVVPQDDELPAVLGHLDRETARIDALVQKKTRFIELLREKRQALITHAVTKGLAPDVKMKDSGVAWLGETPEHWAVKKLKYLCRVQTGDKDTVNAIDDGKYPFFVRSQTVESINSFTADCEAVLTAGDGVGVGKVFHYYCGKFDFHQRVYMFNQFSLVEGRFFYFYLLSNFHKVALDGGAKSTVDSLRLPLIQNFDMTIPPVSEQRVIVDFIEAQCGRLNVLISRTEQSVSLLIERRAALITAAVTGQIDLREAR